MRFAILSDSPPLNTGYGIATQCMLKELDYMGHDVASFGLGHAGDVVRYKGMDIYPGATPFMLQKSLMKFKPDVLMHMRDNWIFIPKYVPNPYALLPMTKAAKIKLINWTPVQAAPLPPEFVETIDAQADYTFVTNQFGVDQLVKQGAPADRLGLLYDGVDTSTYRNFKVERKGSSLPEGKKMAIFVGANMDYRKQIPLSMLAFKKYLDKHDDAVLYLHTNPLGGFDIPLFIHNLGLDKTCFLKSGEGMKLMTWDLSTDEMALMYNMGDVFLSLTAAEGFNQPAMEAMACGLPVVITDTPIHREVFSCFGERAFFVKSTETVPTVWTFEHHADVDDAAEKLEKAFELGKKPMNMQEHPQYLWKTIAKKFAKQAEKVVDEDISAPWPPRQPKQPEPPSVEVKSDA